MSDINFILSQGTSGSPNSFVLSRARTMTKLSKKIAGRQSIKGDKPLFNNAKVSEIFEFSFNNTTNVLKQGESLMIAYLMDIKTIIDCKIFIDDVNNSSNGLGTNSALSFGISTHDLTQLDTLAVANNLNQNLDFETLPYFTSNLDNNGNPVQSFKTNKTYFADSFSTASPVKKDIKDMKNTLFGFSQSTLSSVNTNKTTTGLSLFNSGSVDIVSGRIRGIFLFVD